MAAKEPEKDINCLDVVQTQEVESGLQTEFKDIPLNQAIPPSEDDEFVDPRLKNYPIPLVAKVVGLENDPNEPILTFRFWFLSTFWITAGCLISSFYLFKPYGGAFSSYAVQLLSWGMGRMMAAYLPTRTFTSFGFKWSLNPGPWNAKEHALLVVAYWGSCYTALGMNPLAALELYYGRKISTGWSIIFLLASQMIGYGFIGIYRDVLVRPPKMYYPGVLPNVSLFSAMHNNPAATKKALKFFTIVACAAFVWEWFPQFIFPLLTSLPLVCYFGHGHWKPYILGSGNYGFGMFDFSLDWNYINFLNPMYTPLWSNAHAIAGAIFASWFLYPIMYFTNTMGALNFPAMNSGTFDEHGKPYNITRIMTPEFTLNKTAMDAYSTPRWAPSYSMYFFWGFAATAGSIVYAILWYGKDTYLMLLASFRNRRNEDYDDPYLKVMSHDPRVPNWWYLALAAVCAALAFAQIYEGDMKLSWWGFIVTCLISFFLIWPNGILFGVANVQIGMAFLSEVICGALFPGQPAAVLTSYVYGTQLMEQGLNLISDYKFGFYMKIPEREMFVGQVWGTFIGPFVNFGILRLVLDRERRELTGEVPSVNWRALGARNMFSISVLWGIVGPKVLFNRQESPYHWIPYGFVAGAALVFLVWLVHKWKPGWELETRFNPVLLFKGAAIFPVRQITNLWTSAVVAFIFMGYVYRCHPVWFRKYNYLLGVGLDCGTELMQTVLVFCFNLPGVKFPAWWGSSAVVDRCYPPAGLPRNAVRG